MASHATSARAFRCAAFHSIQTHNLRVFDLIGKDPVFAELVEHSIAVELVRHVIGAPFSLSNFSANVTAPGSGAMVMDADQGYVPAPWPPYPFAINVAWALDDFTEANGATRFVPGSHKRDHGPRRSCDHCADRMPRREYLRDGRTRMASAWRESLRRPNAHGTVRMLCAAVHSPAAELVHTIKPEVLARMSPLMQEMLGFGRNVASSLESLYLKRGKAAAAG